MRQIDTARKRLADKGAWFRVGLASATVAAPLISRWNDLRASERIRDFADDAEDRIRKLGTWVPWSRRKQLEREAVNVVREVSNQATGQRGRASSVVWLAGVGVGIVAAGAAAYVLVRRRLDEEAEQPIIAVVAPQHTSNGHANEFSNEPPASANGFTSAVANAPLATEEEPAEPVAATTSDEPDDVAAASDEAEPADEDDMTDDALQPAQFIGNIRTMVYHEADAEGLPAEENRIYFASEVEAQQAGFRRDRDEIIPSTESEVPMQNTGSVGH